jgi:hypothetical protein
MENKNATMQSPRLATYDAIHQQAHQDLHRLSEPVPENKKVCDFLHGINDPQYSTIKLNILSNMSFMNDFAQMVNYIASAIDMTTKNASTTARQISELNRSGINNNGHGRGRGRESGGNLNNRGRGRGQGHGRNSNGGRGRNSLKTIIAWFP